MNHLHYTAKYPIPSLSFFDFKFIANDSEIEKVSHIIIKWALICNIILIAIVYARFFIIESVTPQAYAENIEMIKRPSPSGEHTNNFLLNSKLSPTITSDVIRKPFTVKGRTVALNNDNIQIFEYADTTQAQTEASMLIKKYEEYPNRWSNNIHIYVKDKLVIFYMGNNKDILESLN